MEQGAGRGRDGPTEDPRLRLRPVGEPTLATCRYELGSRRGRAYRSGPPHSATSSSLPGACQKQNGTSRSGRARQGLPFTATSEQRRTPTTR